MSTSSVGEPVSYPTSKTSRHAQWQRENGTAPKRVPVRSKDRYTPGESGHDPQLVQAKKLSTKRLERRAEVANKAADQEKKWRKETRVERKKVKRNRWVGQHTGSSSKNSGSTVVVADLGLNGKRGKTNSLATTATYAQSAYQNAKNGDLPQALSDAGTASSSLLQTAVDSKTGKVAKQSLKAVSNGVNGLSLANDGGHMVYSASKGHTADTVDRAANATLSGIAMVPGPVGVVGKVGLAADLAMSVSGGDQFIQDTITAPQDAKLKRINNTNSQAARLVSQCSAEEIRVLHKRDPQMLARAISGYKANAAQHSSHKNYVGQQFDRIERIHEALQGTY